MYFLRYKFIYIDFEISLIPVKSAQIYMSLSDIE